MPEIKRDLILHPVRMRIIGLLMGGRTMTAQEMLKRLGDVPLPSLYRHLQKLLKAGLLTVVAENPVRGTVEKVYAMKDEQLNLTKEDLQGANREEQRRYFMTFMAHLLDDFDRYLQKEDLDFERDGVGYRQIPLDLSDDEFAEFLTKLYTLIHEVKQPKPGKGRKRRLFSMVIFPDEEQEVNEKKE